tara:strand:- start:518 stop:718 length:201 start_codon:yes stop_codon:yes gene_type:complete
MIEIKIGSGSNKSLEATKCDIESASVHELADALELLHYLARDLQHQDLAWKILHVSDELKERAKNG